MPRHGARQLRSVKNPWRRMALHRNSRTSHAANGTRVRILSASRSRLSRPHSLNWSIGALMVESAQVESPTSEAAGAGLERKSEGATRLVSLDAFRGLVMVLMLGEAMHLPVVAQAFPHSLLWRVIGFNTEHVEWQGCSLHDLIQPAFSFLVGAALPFSIASRRLKGQTFGPMVGHAVRRAFILIFLGIFLRSLHSSQTYFTFEDTLTQIGLGYVFLFLLGFVTKEKWLWVSLGVILFGYWLAWALFPVAGPGFDWQAVGVPSDWTHHYSGFMAHWNKNANLGNTFDQWFLNLFPHTSPFVANEGGYLTLSFIPTLGTMILGLIAGRWLRAAAPNIPFRRLLIAGVAGIALGLLLHVAGVCPVVKRIWTPR